VEASAANGVDAWKSRALAAEQQLQAAIRRADDAETLASSAADEASIARRQSARLRQMLTDLEDAQALEVSSVSNQAGGASSGAVPPAGTASDSAQTIKLASMAEGKDIEQKLAEARNEIALLK